MTKYLVTGGAGFIGSHIATHLANDGHDVRIFDNLSTGNIENFSHIERGIDFFKGDLRNYDQVNDATQGVDIIFHQAALASVPRSVENPIETHEACVTGTVNLLDAARKNGVKRVVYAASSSAYGNQPDMPKHEGQVPELLSPYAAAKLAGELYCEAFASSYDLETVRIRYFNVFGPRQDPDSPYSAVIPLFVSALLSGKQPTIFGDGLQSRDFTFVGNVVDANILAAKADDVSGNVYNVACGESLNLNDLLAMICEMLGCEFNPVYAAERIGDVKHSWADISAANKDLGYSPQTDLRAGLQETVDYYKSIFQSETVSK